MGQPHTPPETGQAQLALKTGSSASGAPETQAKQETVMLTLPHCGQLQIDGVHIQGWFHPIELDLWKKIIGFHRWISKEYNSESVSYHRWNNRTNQYDTIIPWQVTNRGGLSVRTPWAHAVNKQLLDEYAAQNGEEFFPACTIHTHVNAAAFESGTDAGDEEDQPGWHLTIGHLCSHKQYDLAARFRLPKIKKVRSLTNVDRSYEIDPEHLFPRGTKMDDVQEMADDDYSWHEFCNRVRLT